MPRIPMGPPGGSVLLEPGPVGSVPRGAFGEDVFAAGAQLGAVIGDIGRQEMAEQQRQMTERQRAEAELRDKADRATVASRLADAGALLREQRDALTQEIATGQIDKTKAPLEWRTRFTSTIEKQTKDLPQAHVGLARVHLQEQALHLGDTVRQAVARKDVEDTRAGLMSVLESYERDAAGDRTQATARAITTIEQLGPWAGLGADDRQRLAQSFKERAAFNAAGALVRGARDDAKALDDALGRIKSDEFADLSPEKFGHLEQQVLNRKQALMHAEAAARAKAEAAMARRERQAESAFKAVQGLIDSGATPDAGFLAKVQAQTGGTVFDGALKELLQTASENAGFAVLSPAQQQAELLRLRAEANTRGSNLAMEQRMAHLQRVADKSMEQLREEPLVYGAQRRLIGPIQPLSFGSLDALSSSLGERIEQAQTVSARVGAPVSPLLRAEAHQVADLLRATPLAQRDQAIQILATAVQDPRTMQALAAQIDAKDRTLALAMYAAGKRTASGDAPTSLMLRGKDAVDAGRIKETDEPARLARQSMARKLSEVPWPTPQARDAAIDAAHWVWLGLSDQKRASESKAIEIATGGLASWADQKVTLPFGMGEREFTRAMRDITPDKLVQQAGGADAFSVNGQKVGAKDLVQALPRVRLIPTGSGEYALDAGGMVMVGPRVFRLRVER